MSQPTRGCDLSCGVPLSVCSVLGKLLSLHYMLAELCWKCSAVCLTQWPGPLLPPPNPSALVARLQRQGSSKAAVGQQQEGGEAAAGRVAGRQQGSRAETGSNKQPQMTGSSDGRHFITHRCPFHLLSSRHKHPPELAGLPPGNSCHFSGCLLGHLVLLAAPPQAFQLDNRVVDLLDRAGGQGGQRWGEMGSTQTGAVTIAP